MKLLKSLLFAFVLISVIASCSKDDDVVPFDVKFEVSVTGDAPNATIAITNQTTGASTFEWTYGLGANEEGSALQSPTNFTVEKAGEFTITLKASDGSNEKTAEAKITINGNSAILTFTDVEFALNAGDATYGRLFSIVDGRIYKDSEITAEMASKIDLAFGSMGNTLYYFESPNKTDYQLTGASTTKVDNSVLEADFAVATFDGMTNDADISS